MLYNICIYVLQGKKTRGPQGLCEVVLSLDGIDVTGKSVQENADGSYTIFESNDKVNYSFISYLFFCLIIY